MTVELRIMGSRAIHSLETTKKVKVDPTRTEKINEAFKAAVKNEISLTNSQAHTKTSVDQHAKFSKEESNASGFQITLNLVYGLYTGCHQYGKPHGFGIMTFNEKDPLKRKIFRGNYKDGKAYGWGELTWVSGIIYEGNFKDDEITGSGTMKWPDGRRYQGSFTNGKKTGKGFLRFISGMEYTGDFKNDEYHGKGIYKFSNGDRYEGDFSNGKMTGQGKKIYKNGMTYEGTWVNGDWISGTEYLSEEDDKLQNELTQNGENLHEKDYTSLY